MASQVIAPVPHPKARCCWCEGPLYRIGANYWCKTQRCANRQRAYGIGVQTRTGFDWLYVPVPKQVVFEHGRPKYGMYGGAAGGSKSHGARWALYRYALTVQHFEALLLRRTFPELEKTHLRRMPREVKRMQDAGIDCEFKKSDRQVVFNKTGAIIEAGHMEDKDAVERYLSTEYDGIAADEGSGYDPDSLLELSTRTARTTRPEMEAAGGAFFWVLTNPGGAATRMLVDMFIDHTPDLERYPALALINDTTGKPYYDPDEWRYVEAKIEDNPYLDPSYEASLAVLGAVRYEQLRHANWRVFSGQFFSMWRDRKDGAPFHVQALVIRGDQVQWFRSLDWGRSNPGCVLWWAILPDRHYHIAAELKFVDMDVVDICREIRVIDKMLGIERVLYTAPDPALFIKNQDSGQKIGTSIADLFAANGIRLRPGISNDRVNGWARCRELLGVDSQGRPWVTVSPTCKYLTRTMPTQLQDKHNPEDLDTSGDDHAVDTFRMGAMSQPPPPRFVVRPPPPGSVGEEIERMRVAVREAEA